MNRFGKRGFTRIELAVVAGILILLGLVLVPMNFGIRRTPHSSSQCMGQIAQIGKSLVLYYEDNQLRLPPGNNDTWIANSHTLGGIDPTTGNLDSSRPLAPYIKYGNLFECPSDKGNAQFPSFFQKYGSSYTYPAKTYDGIQSVVATTGIGAGKGLRITDPTLANTTKKIVLFESNFQNNRFMKSQGSYDRWHLKSDSLTTYAFFLDGHVAVVRSKGYTLPAMANYYY